MAILSCDLNDGWRFQHGFSAEMTKANYDDRAWRTVDLPHDWCVDEAFTPNAAGGARNAWLPQGTACYRLRITPERQAKGLRPVLCIGGIAGKSTIYLNGQEIGGEEWAFAPIELELDSAWKTKGENVLAIAVGQSDTPVCRWYEGAGMYRTARLEYRSRSLEIVTYGLFAHTVSIADDHSTAVVNTRFRLKNRTGKRICGILKTEILDPSGKIILTEEKPHTIPATHEMWNMEGVNRTIEKPCLWSPDTPNLYTMKCTLTVDGQTVDVQSVRFGIRTAKFDANNGFLLNGEPVKLNGVCLHNDLGALGSACPDKGILRQLTILKNAGCNAIRTSHNPYGENFLDLCDSVGMLVMAEFFDEWQEPQLAAPISDGEFLGMNVNYYWHLFDKRAERDIDLLTKRDRNHPSIILWSIGNEVKQMYKFSGKNIAGRLQELVHNADPSRPVTCAVVVHKICHENIDVLDVGGYNYPTGEQLDEFHARHPNQPIVVTECYSAQTRRPLGMDTINDVLPGKDCAYGETQNYISWFEYMQQGYDAWKSAADRNFVSGSFIWTGFDYLGETTPYDYPAHGAFFGVFDICGFPKDGAFFYRSVWQASIPQIHIANNWDAKTGDTYFVTVISNCPTCELYLNGRKIAEWQNERIHCMKLPFEPGELFAIGRDEDGLERATDEVHTSRKPKKIVLTPFFDSKMNADGHDLEFIKCEIIDETGARVRNAALPITFTVTGAGSLEALDNGLQTSTETYRNTNVRHTCAGRCLAIVKAGRSKGKIKVRAKATGLPEATLEIEVEPL